MTSPAPIRIRLFAALQEQAGWSEREWASAGSAGKTAPLTPEQLWNALELPGPLTAIRIAINHEFAACDTVLQPGDELAFLPPISGG